MNRSVELRSVKISQLISSDVIIHYLQSKMSRVHVLPPSKSLTRNVSHHPLNIVCNCHTYVVMKVSEYECLHSSWSHSVQRTFFLDQNLKSLSLSTSIFPPGKWASVFNLILNHCQCMSVNWSKIPSEVHLSDRLLDQKYFYSLEYIFISICSGLDRCSEANVWTMHCQVLQLAQQSPVQCDMPQTQDTKWLSILSAWLIIFGVSVDLAPSKRNSSTIFFSCWGSSDTRILFSVQRKRRFSMTISLVSVDSDPIIFYRVS